MVRFADRSGRNSRRTVVQLPLLPLLQHSGLRWEIHLRDTNDRNRALGGREREVRKVALGERETKVKKLALGGREKEVRK